ncbi:hypothetical protein [Salipiger thiooxidans]|uniref:hypothetical protein n=1 Tax=Salipiger thiooxidans TaxID=282683 RepID=UPI001CD51B1B|nr:hypothetical protein [Salipiger thiooxidans]MCA0848792.1 hypothetical protein [Salipiger thiooxidans]
MVCLFGQSDALAFQLSDAFLVGFDHARAGGIHDPVEQRVDLLAGIRELRLDGFTLRHSLDAAHLPDIGEDGLGKLVELRGGLQAAQDGFCPIFDIGTANRLTLGGAAWRVAEIIRVELVAALRPAGGHRLNPETSLKISADQIAMPQSK